MKLDKTMFLVLAMITLFFVFLVGILARFGSKISTDPSFNMFFSWYVGLFMINLLNILGTLLFHFFLTDLPGERGLKGKPGEKGLEGEHDKCFCNTAFSTSMESINKVINAAQLKQSLLSEIQEIKDIREIIILKEDNKQTTIVLIDKLITYLTPEIQEFNTLIIGKKRSIEEEAYDLNTWSVDRDKIVKIAKDYEIYKSATEKAGTNANLISKLEKIKSSYNENEEKDMVTLIKQELQPEIYGEATNIHSHGVTFNDASGNQINDLSTSLIHKHNPAQNSETEKIEDGGRVTHDHT